MISCQRSERSLASAFMSPSCSPVFRRRLSTWPPVKPRSTRAGLSVASAITSVSLRRLDELCQHAAGRLRVQERDTAFADAGARLFVDQLQTGIADGRQGGVDVVGAVGDVVHARALAFDELAHRRVRAGRAHQLDVAVADLEQHGLDPLLLDGLAVLLAHAEGIAVQREGAVEVLDGDSDVIDAPEHGRGSLLFPRFLDALGRGHARARGDPVTARIAGPDDPLDVGPFERFVLEQCLGELVQRRTVLCDQVQRASVGEVGEVLLLVVDRATRRVGERVVVGGHLARGDSGPHPVVDDHRAADAVHLREVVGGPCRDRTEDGGLGRAAAEQHDEIVAQLVLRLQVAVLVGEVERVAERPAAGNDRDLVDLLDRGQQLRAERVARLVEGDDALLVLVHRPARLHPGDDALECIVEVGGEDDVAARAAGEDRGLVADVREVGAGQAARLARDEVEVDGVDRLVLGVDLEDLLAPDPVRRRDEHLTVEAARAQ